MGADRAIHIQTDVDALEPLLVAKLLRRTVEKENADLLLLGKQVSSQSSRRFAGLVLFLLV